jgi:hypothetical protein
MHLKERRQRPPATEGPQKGTWVSFWEVRDLRRLSQEKCFPVSDLTSEEGKPLSPAFIPHGPVAIRGQRGI